MKFYLLPLSFLFSFVFLSCFNSVGASKKTPNSQSSSLSSDSSSDSSDAPHYGPYCEPSSAPLPNPWFEDDCVFDHYPSFLPLEDATTEEKAVNYFSSAYERLLNKDVPFPSPDIILKTVNDISPLSFMKLEENYSRIAEKTGRTPCIFIDLTTLKGKNEYSVCFQNALNWFYSTSYIGSSFETYIFFEKSPTVMRLEHGSQPVNFQLNSLTKT